MWNGGLSYGLDRLGSIIDSAWLVVLFRMRCERRGVGCYIDSLWLLFLLLRIDGVTDGVTCRCPFDPLAEVTLAEDRLLELRALRSERRGVGWSIDSSRQLALLLRMEGVTCRCSKNGGGDGGCGVGFMVRNQKGRSTGRCRCRLQRFVKYLVWVEGSGLVKKSFCTTDRLHSVKSDIFLTSIDEKIS